MLVLNILITDKVKEYSSHVKLFGMEFSFSINLVSKNIDKTIYFIAIKKIVCYNHLACKNI